MLAFCISLDIVRPEVIIPQRCGNSLGLFTPIDIFVPAQQEKFVIPLGFNIEAIDDWRYIITDANYDEQKSGYLIKGHGFAPVESSSAKEMVLHARRLAGNCDTEIHIPARTLVAHLELAPRVLDIELRVIPLNRNK